jgi:hypothetical protein
MRNEKDLFAACRLLFGEEIELSLDFLSYLREEGIAGAFRKKALECHPDRAILSGGSKAEAQNAFYRLQDARRILRQHVSSRQRRAQTANLLPEKRLLFGRFLYYVGIADFRQIVQALAWQKSGRLRIGELAVKMGYLQHDSINVILDSARRKSRFGLTAWELGLLQKDEIQKILQYQRGQQKKIGQFFVEQGVISQAELEALLSRWREHNEQIQSNFVGGKSMVTNERRKHTRVPFRTAVDVAFKDAFYTDCATENISTHGVFIDNILNRNQGDGCRIVLKLTGSTENLTLSIKGKVCRLTKDGIGLQFEGVDLDSYSHLRNIIHFNSNDSC